MDGEDTPDKHRGLTEPWKPGQSGNPNGRPKGSRSKLGEKFISDLYADWQANGVKAIETVRTERPHEYLKVVASMLPKQLEIKDDRFGEFTDDQLQALVAAARNALGVAEPSDDRAGQALN